MIQIIPFIFLIIYFTSFSYMPYILDKKTKPKGNDGLIETKYNVLFCFVNIFCFLFLNKIREKRKINFYKNRILHYDQNFIKIFGFESLSPDGKLDYNRMKRYLKLKKINEKS